MTGETKEQGSTPAGSRRPSKTKAPDLASPRLKLPDIGPTRPHSHPMTHKLCTYVAAKTNKQ